MPVGSIEYLRWQNHENQDDRGRHERRGNALQEPLASGRIDFKGLTGVDMSLLTPARAAMYFLWQPSRTSQIWLPTSSTLSTSRA